MHTCSVAGESSNSLISFMTTLHEAFQGDSTTVLTDIELETAPGKRRCTGRYHVDDRNRKSLFTMSVPVVTSKFYSQASSSHTTLRAQDMNAKTEQRVRSGFLGASPLRSFAFANHDRYFQDICLVRVRSMDQRALSDSRRNATRLTGGTYGRTLTVVLKNILLNQ